MAKSKSSRPPKRRKPLRSEKKQKNKQSRPQEQSSPSSDSIFSLLANIPQIVIDQALNELHQAIKESLEEFMSDSLIYDKLNPEYQDDQEIAQDFQTLIEEANATEQQEVANDITRVHTLFEKYTHKLYLLHYFLIYTDYCLDSACELNDDKDEYKYDLTSNKLGSFLSKLMLDDCMRATIEREGPFAEDLKESIRYEAEHDWEEFKSIIAPDLCDLSEEIYPKFDKKLKETICKFMMQRAHLIFAIDDKYKQLKQSDEELIDCLLQLRSQSINDVNHKLAKPFEYLLSDDLSIPPNARMDTTLLYPQLFKIFLKYTPHDIDSWADSFFELTCLSYDMSGKEFLEKMLAIKEKRLHGQNQTPPEQVTIKSTNKIKFKYLEAQSKEAHIQEIASPDEASLEDSSAKDEATTLLSLPATKAPKNPKAPKTEKAAKPKAKTPAKIQAESQNAKPECELNFRNNFELLCAVVLSTRSSSAAVNAVTEKLFAVAPTPRDMATLGTAGITPYVKELALWMIKAERLAQIAQTLHHEYNDEVPTNSKELQKLPGIGPKTAQTVLQFAII